jgi:hypothetical protein
VLADDLFRTIALDALGAAVPGRHVAVGVEHEDRVVPDAFNQQAKTLLALSQRFLVLAPLREIAGDLRETAQLAGRHAQRGDDDVRPE